MVIWLTGPGFSPYKGVRSMQNIAKQKSDEYYLKLTMVFGLFAAHCSCGWKQLGYLSQSSVLTESGVQQCGCKASASYT